jgi:hypothetical protein
MARPAYVSVAPVRYLVCRATTRARQEAEGKEAGGYHREALATVCSWGSGEDPVRHRAGLTAPSP